MKRVITIVFLFLSYFSFGQTIEQDTALANTYSNQGMEIYKIGRQKDVNRMNGAIDTLNKAADLYKAHGIWGNWASTKGRIGKAKMYLSQFEEAISLMQSSIEFLNEELGEENLPSAYLWDNFSFIYDSYNDTDAAIKCLLNVIKIKQKHLGEFYDDLGYDYSGLGVQYRKKREYDKALEYLQKGRTACVEEFGEKHTRVAATEMQIGIIYDIIGNPEKAIEYYLASLDFYNSINEEIHSEQANLFWTLGISYGKTGEFEESISYLTKAANYYEEVVGFKNPTIYYLYRELASTNYKMENYEKAIDYDQKTLDGFIKTFGENHLNVAVQSLKVAGDHREAGNYSQTLALVQKALHFASNGFNEADYSKNPSLEQINNNYIAAWALIEKSSSFYAMSSNAAEKQTVIESTNLFDALVQRELQNLGNQFTSKTNLFELGEGVYRDAYIQGLEAAISLNNNNQDEKYLNSAFQFAEKSKSLILTQQMNEAEAKLQANIDESVLAEERGFKERISDLESKVLQLIRTKDTVELVKVRDDSLFNIKRAYEEFVDNLELENPQYFEYKYGFTFPSLLEVQNLLEDDEIIIEYLFSKEENGLTILTIDKTNSLKSVNVPIENLNKKAIALNRLLRSHNLLRADRRQKFINLSHDLYNQFIKPIERQLVGKEKIIIIGEGVTNYIPFEVLLKRDENKPYHELDYLVKDFEMSYHYSGTLFKRSRETEMEYSGDILAFAPVFAEEGFSPALGDNTRWFSDSTLRAFDGENFSPLIYSEKEVNDIQNIFKANSNSTILLHELADESKLKSELEKNYRFVHIASHSFANIDHPKFSGIACAQSESEAGEDNILYVGEIYNLDINSDLVVLSSCESGIGKLVSGEGLLGLNRSFVYAGVPNVIYSLWKVYDQATSNLMTEFYAETLSGKEYSSALRNAKLKLLSDPVTASPDIWGAFLLIGR